MVWSQFRIVSKFVTILNLVSWAIKDNGHNFPSHWTLKVIEVSQFQKLINEYGNLTQPKPKGFHLSCIYDLSPTSIHSQGFCFFSISCPSLGPWQPSGFRVFPELLKFLLEITKVAIPHLGKPSQHQHTFFKNLLRKHSPAEKRKTMSVTGLMEVVNRWEKISFCHEREPRDSSWPPTANSQEV